MSEQFLIVFIDSLPFLRLTELSFFSMLHSVPLSPTFGYSECIKSWMFAGISPSELGALGLWRIRLSVTPRKGKRLLELADSLTSHPSVNRAVRWALRKAGMNYDFVPFAKLPYFERAKSRAEDLLKTSWGRRCRVITYKDFDIEPRVSKRDEVLFEAAMQAVISGEPRIFVVSCDLDHTAHRFGLDSLEYIEHLRSLNRWCELLFDAFIKRHPDGATFFFSDHGMCPVKTYEIPALAGLDRLERMGYRYFIDATMLRIWTEDGSLDMETHRRLSQLLGRFLTQEEREHWGIGSRALGDFIFLLNEGVVFCPSYFFLKPVKAMHGYHPDLDSQKGFAASHERTELPQTPWEVHEFISKLASGGEPRSIGEHPDDHAPAPGTVELA